MREISLKKKSRYVVKFCSYLFELLQLKHFCKALKGREVFIHVETKKTLLHYEAD